jgi:hypothetical protein
MYVSNIYKYYLAYKMIAEERGSREKAKEALKGEAGKWQGSHLRRPSSKTSTREAELLPRFLLLVELIRSVVFLI